MGFLNKEWEWAEVKMKGIYLVIWIVSIPYATLRNQCLIENWTSMGTTEPFYPFYNLSCQVFLQWKMVLYEYLHCVVNLASFFEYALITLYMGYKPCLVVIVERLTTLNKVSSVSTVILRWGQTFSNTWREILRNLGDVLIKWLNGSLEA